MTEGRETSPGPLLSAASVGWDCMKISYGLCCAHRWRRHRNGCNMLVAGTPCAVTVACPTKCTEALGGCWAEAAACPHSTLPRAEFPAPDPKGLQRQVAGHPPWQQSCSVFCLKRFVPLLFQLIVSVTASKNSQQCRCCDCWCQPPCLLPSAFLLPFPFLVASVATQICEKRLAFYRHLLPSTVLFSVFVG